jgi:hypothetical protein
VRFSHSRKSKSPKELDPVSKAVAEDKGRNYRQKTFVNALKNGPGNVKVDDKPMSMSYSPPREKFSNQRLHYLIDEILAIEIALRGHQICHVKTHSPPNNRKHEFWCLKIRSHS